MLEAAAVAARGNDAIVAGMLATLIRRTRARRSALGAIGWQPRRHPNASRRSTLQAGSAWYGRVCRRPDANTFCVARRQNTGFPEASLICDFQVVRICSVTVSGNGT